MDMNERQNGVKRTKKIALEEHWANQELNDLRTEWGKRTGYPVTIDPKAIGYSFPRAPDFEEYRLPFMDEFGIAMQVISTGSPGIQGYADAQTAITLPDATASYGFPFFR